MSVACSSPPLLSSSSCSTATLDAQCSLSDLNHDHPRPVFPAGPQPRPSPPSVPCRTSTTTIHAQCSLPDLNREYPRQVFPAGPHVGRYGTKNVQKKVRKNVRQVCYILLANSRVCGRVTGAMPLLTLQVAKFEAISLNRWQSHWGGQRHFHFCTFGAVCKDAWDRQHLTASYYKLLEVISCWIDAWDSQHHTGFLYHSYGGMVDMWHRNICWSIWALIYSIAGQRQDGHHHRRIQQEEVVWSVVSSCVFLFAWQVMAEGDQSASAAQARSLSGSKHIGQWLLELVHAEFKIDLKLGEETEKIEVIRWQFPLLHGMLRTAYSAQGLTLDGGVLVDLRRGGGLEDADWWLAIYVMLTRARKLKNLILLGFTEQVEELLRRGPPTYLRELTDKLETKAASTLERLQSWPVYDALQASWHSALPVGPNRFWLKRSGGGIGLTRCSTCGT